MLGFFVCFDIEGKEAEALTGGKIRARTLSMQVTARLTLQSQSSLSSSVFSSPDLEHVQ